MKSCKQGEILRNAYTRKNGTYVAETCVKDMGAPGKGIKTLPDFKGDFHLGTYGYKLNMPESVRRKAIRMAMKDNDPLMVLRHLNLTRNKQGVDAIKNKFSKDVEYASEVYKRMKRDGGAKDETNHVREYICVDGKCDELETYKEIHYTSSGKILRIGSADKHDIQDLIGKQSKPSEIEKYAKLHPMFVIHVNDKLRGFIDYSIGGDNSIIINNFGADENGAKQFLKAFEKYAKTSDINSIRVKSTGEDDFVSLFEEAGFSEPDREGIMVKII